MNINNVHVENGAEKIYDGDARRPYFRMRGKKI